MPGIPTNRPLLKDLSPTSKTGEWIYIHMNLKRNAKINKWNEMHKAYKIFVL